MAPTSPYKHQAKLLRKLTKVSPQLERYKYDCKRKSLQENIMDYYKTKYGKKFTGEETKVPEIE